MEEIAEKRKDDSESWMKNRRNRRHEQNGLKKCDKKWTKRDIGSKRRKAKKRGAEKVEEKYKKNVKG